MAESILAAAGGGTSSDDFESFKKDLTALVGALRCSTSPTRTGPDPRPSSRRRRNDRMGNPPRRRGQPNSSSLLSVVAAAASSIHGPSSGSRAGSTAARRRTGPATECAGPCCATPTRPHPRSTPQPTQPNRPQEQQGVSSNPDRSLSVTGSGRRRRRRSPEPARRWRELPPSLQLCYVVHDPTFNASTLLVPGTG
jgi:hypothetical protein